MAFIVQNEQLYLVKRKGASLIAEEFGRSFHKPSRAHKRGSREASEARATEQAAGGYGGQAVRARRGRGMREGTPALAKRVKNLGSGVWGFGVVVGWVPCDVSPWHYCRRMGWVQIFSRTTKPLLRTRPYVLGDDGKYHLPERWEVVK